MTGSWITWRERIFEEKAAWTDTREEGLYRRGREASERRTMGRTRSLFSGWLAQVRSFLGLNQLDAGDERQIL